MSGASGAPRPGHGSGRCAPARTGRHRLAASCGITLAWALLALVASRPAPAAPPDADPPYDARLVRVIDGDSLEVEAGGARIEIRIFGIDAPERGQPWSRRAREALAALVTDATLHVVPRDRDTYGRTVADVYAGADCVGCALVRGGHAWVYRRYTEDPERLALEATARAGQRGLWGLPAAERLPPWEWRHGGGRRSGKRGAGTAGGAAAPDGRGETSAPSPADTAAFQCGTKRRCNEMHSCSEALFHLRCGISTLDGDGDGRPCEALCRREADATRE